MSYAYSLLVAAGIESSVNFSNRVKDHITDVKAKYTGAKGLEMQNQIIRLIGQDSMKDYLENLKSVSEEKVAEFSKFLFDYPNISQPFSYALCKMTNGTDNLKISVRKSLLSRIKNIDDLDKIFKKLETYMNDMFLGPSDVASMLAESTDNSRISRMERQFGKKIISVLDAFIFEGSESEYRSHNGKIPTVGQDSSKSLIGEDLIRCFRNIFIPMAKNTILAPT